VIPESCESDELFLDKVSGTQKERRVRQWARMLRPRLNDMVRHSLSLRVAVVAMLAPAGAAAQRIAFSDTASCLTREVTQPAGGVLDSMRPVVRYSSPVAGSAQDRGPAIILRASASAREVRFATQPRISVRLCGGVMDSVRVLERRNLPDPVRPGVTYRDVYIAVEILGHLNAECLAGRITGAERGTAAACASIQVRDSAGAGARRPPR
jgi:hypothetical protein